MRHPGARLPEAALRAAQPEWVTSVLQVVQRLITRHLLDGAELPANEGQGGAVTLIQRFGAATNLNIHLYCKPTTASGWPRWCRGRGCSSSGTTACSRRTPS